MKTVALVIGHKKTSPGAVNATSGLTEFVFNEKLSLDIEGQIHGVNLQRVYRRTYTSLPNDLNELNPALIVSLHCNAFNTEVSGTEVLYYHKSTKGKLAARLLNDHLVGALGLHNRGARPKTSEDRGGYLLKNTNAPCVIAEPFFIDNDNDLAIAQEKYAELVLAYVEAIVSIVKEIS
ncbi:N-acetylmuramoyl-L-alanine amidase [Neiella sp. HB171785]|uniref:N-acetylmuramoyl-L-alanine amidase n=1 Tax=Neiella litorisoli TaxID=2771431 RepID=A0A8J6QJQ3_9GAMM|nr:N-acetylmuramoyl-L-alanine amidase [Neiella litorisoli]MBD1389396.1 N-acetylmuramoyl-L-alanine amidase [Neiella litorisoli]